MAEGFKLLDAYVEVKADGKGIADKVAGDIQREAGGRLGRTGSTMGGHLLGGLKGAFSVGAVGGLVGGVVGGVTSGLTSLIGTAVSDIAGMLTQVGGLIATTVIDYNSTLQNAQIGFETMLGSGKKARGFLDDLQSFAKSTPFEFTDLVNASQQLMGMGTAAKDVIPYMRGIGDVVAGMGKGPEVINQVTLAIGQMTAKGKVQGDDLMQLTSAGIPALKILADSYGVTTTKMSDMISAGDVQSKRAIPALIKGFEHGTKSVHGFGGMMDKQSHTFTGALSNIKDGLTQTTAKAFKPFFDSASRGMGRFATALSGKPAERFQKEVTKAIRPLGKEIDKWLKGIDFNKIFRDASKALKGLTKGLDPKDFGKFLKDLTRDAGDIFRDIIKVAPKVIKAIKETYPAIRDTIKGGVQFIGWLGDLVDWFDKTEKAWDKWRAGFVKGMNGFFNDADKFWNSIGAGWDGFWADLGATISHGWSQVVRIFKVGGGQILDFVGSIPGQLATIGGQIVSGFLGGITGAWGSVTSTINNLVSLIPAGVRKLLGIASPSKVFHTIGKQVAQGLHRGLLGSVDDINGAADKLAEAVMDNKRWKGTKLGKRMVAGIRSEARKLGSLSRRRDAALEDVANDKSRLSDLYSQRTDYASNVRSGVMSNASGASIFGESMQTQRDARQAALDFNKDLQPTVMGAGTVTLNGSAYTPSWTTSVAGKAKTVPKVSAHAGLLAVRASLKKLLADTKHFTSNMKKLAKMGVDAFTYDELLNAGVRGGGLETSDALVKDPTLAKQIFTLEHQVSVAGRSLGRTTAAHRYADRIGDARDQLARDQDEAKRINVTMVVEAKKIDEVDKLIRMVNHVKSTSRKGKPSSMSKRRR